MTRSNVRKEKDPDRYSISHHGGWSWSHPIPNEHDSSVVRRFYTLHAIPIGDLSPADIRFLIGQNACLAFLVPKALDLLEPDPWLEAEYHPGDLLSALLRINHPLDYWSSGNKDFPRLCSLAKTALVNPPNGTARKDLRALEALARKTD